MELREMDPKDLIEPSWFDSYEKQKNTLWWQLVLLNSQLYILERLDAFPFNLFLPSDLHFLHLVDNALFESSVMIIWRIAVDDDPDILTIQKLKGRIMKRMLKQEYRKELTEDLKKWKFENRLSSVKKKIREFRRHYIAHFNFDFNVKPTKEQLEKASIQLNELKTIRDALNSLFNIISFGVERSFLPPEYDRNVGYRRNQDNRNDVEKLLDHIVLESPLLRMPEEYPRIWPIHREKMPPDELETLKKLRIQCGLPKI